MTNRRDQIARVFVARENFISLLLTAAMFALSVVVAALALGAWGIALGALLAAFQAVASGSGEWALKLHRAQPLPSWQAPRLARLVQSLTRRARVAAPTLYLVPSPVPNAFATERSDGRGALGVTTGLLRALSPDELEAVLAHEISHLAAGDTRRVRWTTAAANVSIDLLRISVWFGLLVTLLDGEGWGAWFCLLVVSWAMPLILSVIQSAISRSREFAADSLAASLTGAPLALASALTRLQHAHTSWFRRALGARRSSSGWLDSHPATTERIARLRAMAPAHRPRPVVLTSAWTPSWS